MSPEETTVPELLIDFITSLDGYAAADGWPGFLGTGRPRVPRMVGRGARSGLHRPDGRDHLPSDVGICRRGRGRHRGARGHVEGRLLDHLEGTPCLGEHAARHLRPR